MASSLTSSQDVILTLTRSMHLQGQKVGPTFIPQGKPWHNGFVESVNGKLGIK